MLSFSTTDLCDANEERLKDGRLRVVAPGYRIFGRRITFAGPASTVKVFEDNVLVRDALESEGHGRVLVIDGGGSLRCALVGGNLAALGAQNRWAGILVYGGVRDVAEFDRADIGLRALAICPRRSDKFGGGRREVGIRISDTPVFPGEWIYADGDGILVSSESLT